MDRPDETRRVMNFKRLLLTDFKCDLTRLAKKKELQQALDESGRLGHLTLRMLVRKGAALAFNEH